MHCNESFGIEFSVKYSRECGLTTPANILRNDRKYQLMSSLNHLSFTINVESRGCIRCYCTVRESAALPRKNLGLRLFLFMKNAFIILRDEMFEDVVRGIDRIVLRCKPIPSHSIPPIARQHTVPNDLTKDVLNFIRCSDLRDFSGCCSLHGLVSGCRC